MRTGAWAALSADEYLEMESSVTQIMVSATANTAGALIDDDILDLATIVDTDTALRLIPVWASTTSVCARQALAHGGTQPVLAPA